MASGIVTVHANETLTADLKTAAPVYAALFTADPTDAGLLANQVADDYSYARTAITFDDDGATRTIDNSADCTFPVATGTTWGEITHLMICKSGTYATVDGLYYGALTVAKTVGVGDQIVFSTGNVDITFSAGA